jgi:hypothetical protein
LQRLTKDDSRVVSNAAQESLAQYDATHDEAGEDRAEQEKRQIRSHEIEAYVHEDRPASAIQARNVRGIARKLPLYEKDYFRSRWWRVRVELAAVVIFLLEFFEPDLSEDPIWASAIGVPFGVVGTEHLLRGRWLRGTVLLAAALGWPLAGVLLALRSYALYDALLGIDVIFSLAAILWTVVDAHQDKPV